jgi:hypothetical protein
MGGDESVFGVNFIDGRIKAYPKQDRRQGGEHRLYARYVRGNPAYGRNQFQDLGDGTVLDQASGLQWARADSGMGLDWPSALAWAAACNDQAYRGHSDWRLPNAKELQSLVDYSRGPDITGGPALDPVFDSSHITNEAGQKDYPFVWTSTTHRDSGGAAYICFGRAMGYWQGRWVDVHGAGAQRSDPKTGDPADYPQGRGPQGDAIRIKNYARLVRGGVAAPVAGEQDPAPEAARDGGGTQDRGGMDGQPGPGGQGAPEQGAGGRRQPPAAAIAACQGHAEGDRVSFTTPRGDSLECTCRRMGGQLFAVPAGR